MTQNTQKNQKPTLLNKFAKLITSETRSQLAAYAVSQYLLQSTVDDFAASNDPASDPDSSETIEFFKTMLTQSSPLALITAFCDPSATNPILDTKAVKNFASTLPDLYSLCQTPEAQALSPLDIFNELYYGAGRTASLVTELLKGYSDFLDSSTPGSGSGSGLVN